jgi:hypothetical protein
LETDLTADARRHGVGSGASNDQPSPPEIPADERTPSARKPEPRELDRADLRNSEVQTLADIAALRAVKIQDLVQYRYDGKGGQARRDLKHLVRPGLVQRRTTYPDHNVYLGHTRQGRRYIEHNRPANAASRRVFYHGFGRRREACHEAAIYQLYQRERKGITL